jgi:hypothetical protein
MSLIKKIDVEKHFAAKREIRRTGALLVSRPDAPSISEAKTAGTKACAQDFVADFSLEHSSSSTPITPAK